MNFIITCLLLVQFLSLDGAVWEGNLNNFPKEWPINGGSCKDTCQLVKDPTTANSVNNVLHVKYPKGSCSSACGINSGVILHINPLSESEKATLEYEVYFPADFDFYFLNQSSVTFLKINLKINKKILHPFYLNKYYAQLSKQIYETLILVKYGFFACTELFL